MSDTDYDEAEDVAADAELSDDDIPEPTDPSQVPPDEGDLGWSGVEASE
jgi:hypothetical protein